MEWVSVEERKPIEEKDMGDRNYKTVGIIVFNGRGVWPCSFNAGNTTGLFWSEFEIHDVTHWMELPEPPQ